MLKDKLEIFLIFTKLKKKTCKGEWFYEILLWLVKKCFKIVINRYIKKFFNLKKKIESDLINSLKFSS